MEKLHVKGMASFQKLSRKEMSFVKGGVVACQDWYDFCISTCGDDVYSADCKLDCNNQIANHTAPCSYPQS